MDPSHFDVISRFTPTKAMVTICGFCGISKSETKLFVCSGCETAQYCGRECQTAAWKDHKVWCKHNQDRVAALTVMTAPTEISSYYAFGQLNPAESFAALQKWCHQHRPILIHSLHAAMNLKVHPQRGATDVFIVFLRLTRAAERGKETKALNMFNVEDAFTMGKSSLGSLWPKVGEGVRKTDEEHAKVTKENRLAENVSIILVNWGVHVNLMPCFWDQKEIAGIEPLPSWKRMLKEMTKVRDNKD